jgi:ferredoxin
VVPPSESAAGEAVAFAVDRDRCIGCVACLNVFPQWFQMEGDRAVAVAAAPLDAVLPSRVLQCCPVGAISRVTPVSAAQPIHELEFVPGWETAWAAHRNDSEDLVERERRYGRIYQTRKIGTSYLLRIELPRTLPNTDVLYMYGVERRRPEYDVSLKRLGPETWSVRAQLIDPKLRHLSGKLNSFPIGLKVDYRFPEPVGPAYVRLDLDAIYLHAFPEATAEPLEKLAQVIRDQLAGS